MKVVELKQTDVLARLDNLVDLISDLLEQDNRSIEFIVCKSRSKHYKQLSKQFCEFGADLHMTACCIDFNIRHKPH